MDSCISALATAVGTEVKNRQEILVSGTNIKTINGNSILGSGDIEISGSGSIGWNDVVVNGTYVSDLGSGKHQYSYKGTTYYRLVVDAPYTDRIYSDLGCTTLIAERG